MRLEWNLTIRDIIRRTHSHSSPLAKIEINIQSRDYEKQVRQYKDTKSLQFYFLYFDFLSYIKI